MENIETLLAAVAQIDDDEPAPRKLGIEKSEPSPVVGGDDPPPAPAPVVEAVVASGEKRKRGRPPRVKLTVRLPPPKRNKPEDEDEDVCFICFDGGSLVLCDRKGCPKAYHPACIKREKAFFQSKTKWNCGWHICSVCRKGSHYMCYTCTYSLCKGCTKDADYKCVRGKMGFCSTCLKTIMLIENKDQANDDSVQVDFDDQGSWEYLFKVYWVILKEKLSLTLSELTKAKGPWKGLAAVSYNPLSSNVIPSAVSVELPISYSGTEHLELHKPVEISLCQNDGLKTTVPSICNHVVKLINENEEDEPRHDKDSAKASMDEVMQETSVNKATEDPNTIRITDKPCICENLNDTDLEKVAIDHSTEWASKDLLEFVAHMKNGAPSTISKFDVQTLLLDYINRNNLWDPSQRSHIICDPRLVTLFGKPRVGLIEMLKLLELHVLIKEDSQKNSFIPGGFVSSVKSDVEVDESKEDIRSGDTSKKDECVWPSDSCFPQNGRGPISPNKEGNEERFIESRSRMIDETEASGSNSPDKHTNQVNITNPAIVGSNDQSIQRPEMETKTTTTAPVGNSPSSDIIEIEKLWHYRDYSGKIRGPFSMIQLREWSTAALFPPDMRIWTNHEQYDSLLLTDALNGKFHGASDLSNSCSQKERANGGIGLIINGTHVSNRDGKQTMDVSVLSGLWPRRWDLLKETNSAANDGNLLNDATLPDQANAKDQFCHGLQIGENESMTIGRELHNQSTDADWVRVGPPSEVNMRSLNIGPSSNDVELSLSPNSNKHGRNISVLDLPSRTQPNTAENCQSVFLDVPEHNSGILELLSPAPKSNNEDHQKIETKNSGFIIFPDLADEWFKYSSSKPPEVTSDSRQLTHPASNMPSWPVNINEPIEFFDALGEESVSDLLAEVDAMESQGAFHSPTSSMKFARELMEDCKDDCFSSIEEFSRKSDALSSTGEIQLNAIHSSASSEGETNAPTATVGPGVGTDGVDPGWGPVQGNINVVTVQGNVNLVLGGPGQGLMNLDWGINPNLNLSPMNGQRKYGGERFNSPREWGYQGPRPQWGRQPAYGGGGYSRPVPKGQRVCKFFESGRCKKGAFCDYLHP